MSTPKQAFSYLRVSGRTQVEGTGLDRQHDVIAAYAKANNIELAGEFREEGVSGTKELKSRPALAALLAELKITVVPPTPAKLVLVEKADRLGRDLLVSEIILGQFRDLGVTVIEASGGNDLTVSDNDPTRKLIRQVLAAVSEFDKSVTVLKLRGARQRKRQTEAGWTEGRKPFGARVGEETTINRMLHLRRRLHDGKAWSFRRIADALNAEGCPTRDGKLWHPTSVNRVIQQQRARRRLASKRSTKQ